MNKNRFLTCLLSLFLLVLSPEAIAGKKRPRHRKSPECKRLNSVWVDRFYADFKVAWPKFRFRCPSELQAIVGGMDLLQTVSGRKLTEDFEFPDYYSWVIGHISSTQYLREHEVFKDALASAKDGVLYLHHRFATLDRIYAASVLAHEARHLSEGDPSHVVCNHGIYQGKQICDERLYSEVIDGSGNNASFHFLVWIYKFADKLGLDREVARGHICRSVSSFFNLDYESTLKEYSCIEASSN